MATDTQDTDAARTASTARMSRKPRGARAQDGKHRGHIVSHAPGRMRVRLHPEHRATADLQQIERDLNARDGVASVQTNARTGSVLVHYDRHSLGRDDLTAILHDVGIVAMELLGAEEVSRGLSDEVDDGAAERASAAPHSSTATGVLDALTDLDRRLSELTGGKLDVKLLVPIGLGTLALRQILTTGLGLAEVPGYVLLWYTFDSFYKLHQRKTAALVEKAVERADETGPETTTVAAVQLQSDGT